MALLGFVGFHLKISAPQKIGFGFRGLGSVIWKIMLGHC